MSTLLVNDITGTDGSVLNLPGRVVTASHYTSSRYQGAGDNGQTSQPTVPCLLEAFTFYKKFPKSKSYVWGCWDVNNLRESTQGQWYTCQRGGLQIGYYLLRHSIVSGWSMGINRFTWIDTTAEQGTNTYSLVVKDYNGRIYYNYPTNLSGSPNGSSTFLILEITY